MNDSCDPMHCSPPGFSVHKIFQARILEWVAISFFRGSSWPKDRNWVSWIAGIFFANWTTREAPNSNLLHVKLKTFLSKITWLLKSRNNFSQKRDINMKKRFNACQLQTAGFSQPFAHSIHCDITCHVASGKLHWMLMG